MIFEKNVLLRIQNRPPFLPNKYKVSGRKLHLINLNSDCLKILNGAQDMIEVNLLDTVKAASLRAEDKSKRNAQLALRLKESKIF